jgi:hypothetical protein
MCGKGKVKEKKLEYLDQKLYKRDQFNGIQLEPFNQLHNTCYFNKTFLKFIFNMTCFSQYQSSA